MRLDQSIPFVRAALHGETAEAAAILQAAEQRHGLRWMVTDGNLDEDNRDEWYEKHLWPFLSETHLVLAGGDLLTQYSLLDRDGVDHTPTWRHWGGIVAEWANRNWPIRLADPGAPKRTQGARPWEYLDFYMECYLSVSIHEYKEWCAAVLRVLSLTGGGKGA